ncbi:unnamed protein product [Coregonus sp. 'balchen']|nr:unnamed protein product [Coregonus sp. 'balchen']
MVTWRRTATAQSQLNSTTVIPVGGGGGGANGAASGVQPGYGGLQDHVPQHGAGGDGVCAAGQPRSRGLHYQPAALQMSLDGHGSDDSSDSEDSIPPEILERTSEPDSSDEEPPPVYSPPSYDMHIYDRKYPDEVLPTASPPPPSFDASQSRPCQPPPGPPPPASQRQATSLMTSCGSCLSSWAVCHIVEPGAAARAGQVGMETDQLQRNRKFLIALERDRLQCESKTSKSHHSPAFMGMSSPGDNYASGSGEACTNVTDDALFRDKLKHMGKSTRKKLF